MCSYDEKLRRQTDRMYRTIKLIAWIGFPLMCLVSMLLGIVLDSILPSLFIVILGMAIMMLILRRDPKPKCPQCGKDLTHEYLVPKRFGFYEINSLHYCPYCGKDFHQKSTDEDQKSLQSPADGGGEDC
ncbi:MAG: hypothetical protein KAV00_10410 [Phycisphaerae bacterium]|nr:hypothetical protein [Phycisphaerae bacterium]